MPEIEQNPLIDELVDELARLHATIRKDSPELAAAIAWLVARGAPQPIVTEELVTYPGGQYWNVQVIFGTGDKVLVSGAYLLMHNPSVALIELRRTGLAPGDVNRWEPYIPAGFLPPDAPVALPPVGAEIPGFPGHYYTLGDEHSPVGTRTSDPRGNFEKVLLHRLFSDFTAWKLVA